MNLVNSKTLIVVFLILAFGLVISVDTTGVNFTKFVLFCFGLASGCLLTIGLLRKLMHII